MNTDILKKIFGRSKYDVERICKELKLDKTLLEEFEHAYKNASIDNYSSLGKNHNGSKNETTPYALDELKERIVNELIVQTRIWSYNGGKTLVSEGQKLLGSNEVRKEEIEEVRVDLRPMLTGSLMKIDVNGDSGLTLLNNLRNSMQAKESNKQKQYYNMFRQGLDLLDLDPIVYMMLEQNKNAMGYWLPKIASEVDKEGFFKIPKTTIIKVPMTLLQLTRIGYEEINRTTLDIVNEYCMRVFNLDVNSKYFIKTGTYSSKFDFRNARVEGQDEVKSLGEYLLFIHSQALSMAHFDISGMHRPIIYGVSTTNEWVVRDFIEDQEDNLTIYHGLPLHTEYRVFVDFDEKEILGIHPYWDKEKLTTHFEQTIKGAANFLEMLKSKNASEIPNYDEEMAKAYQALQDAKHDLITYTSNYETLNRRYEDNKQEVIRHLEAIIKNCNLTGQWSIDIMQNGNEFYLIDMQGAGNSVYYNEVVPPSKRKKDAEDWVPKLEDGKKLLLTKSQ